MTDLWEGLGTLTDRVPTDDDIHLSQTTVNNAQLCGGKVLYFDHPLYNHTPTVKMSWGSMVHGMAESDLDPRATPRVGQWSPIDVEMMWAEALLNERDGSFDLYQLASREDIDTLVAEAIIAIDMWHREVLPVLDLSDDLAVEERVTKCLGVLPDGRAVWFGGTADLVDRGNGVIYDWKTTGGKPWDQSKADAGNQASYYTWLYGLAKHEYYVYGRKQEQWNVYRTERTAPQVDAALRNAWQVAKAIAYGALYVEPWDQQWGKYKRAWYCSALYCAAWDACEMKAINDNVYEAQAIDIKLGWEM